MDLKDKKVVAMGGSTGIGLAITKATAVERANVVIEGRSPQKLKMVISCLYQVNK